MGFKHIYRKLFSINIYHHYWLDDGKTPFDDTNELKAAQLDKYNINDFIEIIPSYKTQRLLENRKLFYKLNPEGGYVVGKVSENPVDSGIYEPFKKIDVKENFIFLLYVHDPFFENYSTVSAHPDIPFLFSNLKPDTEGGSFKSIDLEGPTTTPITDYTMNQDTYDDILKELQPTEKVGLFGIVNIFMEGDINSKNVLNADGTVKNDPNEYKIQIVNRHTIWHYRKAEDGDLILNTDPEELPLVKNGIVGHKDGSDNEMPSAQPNRILFVDDGGNKKIISEIYIN